MRKCSQPCGGTGDHGGLARRPDGAREVVWRASQGVAHPHVHLPHQQERIPHPLPPPPGGHRTAAHLPAQAHPGESASPCEQSHHCPREPPRMPPPRTPRTPRLFPPHSPSASPHLITRTSCPAPLLLSSPLPFNDIDPHLLAPTPVALTSLLSPVTPHHSAYPPHVALHRSPLAICPITRGPPFHHPPSPSHTSQSTTHHSHVSLHP